jgi:hypothetical protein
MAMAGNTACAVNGCAAPISGSDNLCIKHRLPGTDVRIGESTMVITAWSVEHGDEWGFIALNDYALGALFGGAAGFEAKLTEQGFVNIRNLDTVEDLLAAKRLAAGKKKGAWFGPWRTQYPWEIKK